MYSNADIDSLSVGQLRKLLKGGAVRVRCGSGMKVGLSAPQHKKLMSAHKKGKMMTLTMDPYQSQMHGQGLLGDIGNFFSRTVPSTLIHEGLPIAGGVIGGMGGEYVGGPMGGIVGAEVGSQVGRELANETGRRTGYGMKGRGTRLEDQQFSLRDVYDTGRNVAGMFGGKVKKGRGTRLEDQQFSLRDAYDTGRNLGKMFGGKMKGKGTRLEDQKFSLREAYDTGRDIGKLFGGKVHMKKGKGVLGDMMKMVAPHAKRVAKEVATKLAKKAGSHAIHNVLPSASERLGEMGGEYFGVQGGRDTGRMLGQMLEKELADRTGLGMKKRGRPRKMGGALMVAGMR